MKKNFKEQFNNLRNIIKNNIDSIKGLVAQSESIANLITTLKTDKSKNQKTIDSLEEIKKNITESINNFAKQTEDLFSTYEKMLDEMFGNE
jgi:argininosuccinate lyase